MCDSRALQCGTVRLVPDQSDETANSSTFSHGQSRPSGQDAGAGPDRVIARLAHGQHGLVTRVQLRVLGLDSGHVAYRLSCGRLHRVHRGVYAVGWRPTTMESRFLAAVLACGHGGLLSHAAAAALWRLRRYLHQAPVDVLLPRQIRPRAGIRPHRTDDLHESDVARHWGIPVTNPVRTLLDLATVLAAHELRRAVGQAQVERLARHEHIRAELERRPGHPGAARLAAVTEDGPLLTRSELEDAFVALLDRHGLPRPLLNHDLRLGGRRTEVDAFWPRHRAVVELDGARFHDPPARRRADAAKQARIEAAGLRVLRLTHEQVTRAPAQTLRRVDALLTPA